MTDELEQMIPNQRRARGKALSALEVMASIWAAEIRLIEISARIAAIPTEAERAKRIAAMIEQGFIEGAYRHYLDHKDKCDELAILQAATPTGTTMTIDIINSAADATMSPDEREAFDKFSDDTKQRLLNQILKRASTRDAQITINYSQSQQLLELFGGEEGEMVLCKSDKGHAGAGLYVWIDDYPEEGAMFLDETLAATRDEPNDSADARRYRWLLDHPEHVEFSDFYDRTWLGPMATVSDAIDAAIAASVPKESK